MTIDFDEKECRLTIDDGISSIAIESIGPVRLGFPTRISIISGPFTAITQAEAKDFSAFREALSSLHQDLTGEAILDFWGEEHAIVFSGDGRGRISALIKVTDGRAPWAALLTIKMVIDQSYLPDLIRSIGRVFLNS